MYKNIYNQSMNNITQLSYFELDESYNWDQAGAALN